MNVKHSMMFGLVSRQASDVDPWSQQGRKHGVAWWKAHREETRGCSEDPAANVTSSFSTLLEMWRRTFKRQQQLSFLKPSADIWDSGPLVLRQNRKRGVLYQPRAQEEGAAPGARCGRIITTHCPETSRNVFQSGAGLQLLPPGVKLNLQRLKKKGGAPEKHATGHV